MVRNTKVVIKDTKKIPFIFKRDFLLIDFCLNIDYNIFLLNKIFFGKKSKNYVLSDIATGYLYDGDFERCKKTLNYLEKQKNDKVVKVTVLEKRMIINYFENKHKEALKVKEELINELDGVNKKLKDIILFNVEI